MVISDLTFKSLSKFASFAKPEPNPNSPFFKFFYAHMNATIKIFWTRVVIFLFAA